MGNQARLDQAVCIKQADDEGHIQAAGLLAADLRLAHKGCALEAVRCRRGGVLQVDFRWPVAVSKEKSWQQCEREMTAFLAEEGWPVEGIKYDFAGHSLHDRPWSALITIRLPSGCKRWPPVPVGNGDEE